MKIFSLLDAYHIRPAGSDRNSIFWFNWIILTRSLVGPVSLVRNRGLDLLWFDLNL